nr:ribonuclease H-like domain-containing protein [Tanacetum cinerariifolium]
MTPSSPPSYTFINPTPSPLLNTLTSAPIPSPTHETTQPNTSYGPTPTDPSPSPQSTLLTSIAHNHASGPSTSAYRTSQLPPPTFDFPNPQPNIETIHEPHRTHPTITWSQSGIVKPIDRLSLHTFSISPIPKNSSHALKDPNWRNAMYDEYIVLVKNGTWLLVPRPAGVNMVRFMWLFKHKFHANGTLSHYKARLVANGSSQQLGVDFDETFSPVVKLATICTVFSLVVSRQWPIHQLDVKNAFLNGLFLSLKKYALQLLERAHMVTCNPSRTPVDSESKLGPKGAPVQDPTLYRSFAGGLKYLTFTRLDLSYAVQQICLYMHDPREPHLAALKRILRYVQGTLDFGLYLYASSTTSLVGYTDADWAGCPSTRRSTSGYCVFLGDNLLSWSAKRQHILSRSSAEAEYRVLLTL